MIVEESSAFTFPLPEKGEVVIGRGDEADLKLSAPGASRRHATITVTEGDVRIADLESRNGTLVNGERLAGQRSLLAGDSVGIGTTTMVVFLPPSAALGRQFVDVRAFRRRLQEEIERARFFDRGMGIVTVLMDAEAQRDAAARRIDTELRAIDVAGWLSPTELGIVLPEVTEQRGGELARHLLERMKALRAGARVGFAAYPHAGCDADTLLAAARAAARGRGARSGAIANPDAEARVEVGDHSIVVADPAMMALMDLIRRLAPTDLPVLIQGETGAGKENAAQAVHHWSGRRGPFIAVNCAALTESLAESELFGNEKGAFSGAATARQGLFEASAGGTIFFDEIGDLPRVLQPKLLRVLETKRSIRVGATRERELDVRVVAATNRDLRVEEKEGRFRQDLLFRLNAATLILPPLRDRPREVALLARAFLADASKRLALPPKSFSGASLHLLAGHHWPGNVRELKNVVEYLVATTSGSVIEAEHVRLRLDDPRPLPGAPAAVIAIRRAGSNREEPPARQTDGYDARFTSIASELRALEERRMREALETVSWVQTRAAELIGMPLRTFQQKAKQFGLTRRRPND